MKNKSNTMKFPRFLPVFREYTVDFRLKEFRKAVHGVSLEFIPFDSELGRILMKEMYDELGEDEVDILRLLSE